MLLQTLSSLTAKQCPWLVYRSIVISKINPFNIFKFDECFIDKTPAIGTWSGMTRYQTDGLLWKDMAISEKTPQNQYFSF